MAVHLRRGSISVPTRGKPSSQASGATHAARRSPCSCSFPSARGFGARSARRSSFRSMATSLIVRRGLLRDSGARRAAIQAGQTGEIGDGGGGSYTTLCSDLIADAPSNGFLPVTASNRMQPNEKMPERWSISLVFPCACFRRHVADRAHGRARRGVVRPHGRRHVAGVAAFDWRRLERRLQPEI
jgi:hypothetical protein